MEHALIAIGVTLFGVVQFYLGYLTGRSRERTETIKGQIEARKAHSQ